MDIGRCRFDRMELAGALGDLGALLPIAAGLILVCGLSPLGVFLSAGLFYVGAGLYYRVPVAVQPMKLIGAYAIANAVEPTVIQASGALMAVALLAVGYFQNFDAIIKHIPTPVIRGVQLATGTILAVKGVGFIAGTSSYQNLAGSAEPYLAVQSLLGLPLGIVLGLAFGVLTLILLDNKRFPAGLTVILGGLALGLALGSAGSRQALAALDPGLHLPDILPYGFPAGEAFVLALTAMVLPQLPMTLGNAVIAMNDLTHSYFPSESYRVTPRALCITQGLANALAFVLGGMPMCHGAGGQAAHYRFGSRTSGSNLIIGGIFLVLALGLGANAVTVLNLMPLAVLGVLLIFSGLQLMLAVTDLEGRTGFYTAFLMLAVTMATNLAWAFLFGLLLAHFMRWRRINA